MQKVEDETIVNRFEKEAPLWDESPQRKILSGAIANTLVNSIQLNAGQRVLDYGAGTGLITLEIAKRVNHVVAMDSSPAMLKVLGDKITAFGVENVGVEVCDLEKDLLADKFDVIFSSMTMHHIGEPFQLIKKFHDALLSGGSLAISDLDTESGNFHPDNTGIKHFGFERGIWEAQLLDMGFCNVQATTAYTLQKETESGKKETFTIFVITAQKP